MKEVYILATESADPVSLEALRESFESEEVEFLPGEDGRSFDLVADESRLEVKFESRAEGLGWTPDLITGSDDAHALLRQAKGFYRIAFEPGKPQGSVAVFEALWAARSILEHVPGVVLDVTAFKLHDAADIAEITELDFDIRDHVNLHAVEATSGETPLWVHSHGMEKFGQRDVEIFHLGEQDLLPAESFLHELCTDLAFGQAAEPRTLIETSNGSAFMLVPSEEARQNLMGVSLDTFEGHEGMFLTIVSPEGRHNLAELLRPYRQRFQQEPAEETMARRAQAQTVLPAFKSRFLRKGLMEPTTFLVRAPFETHPEGEPVTEHLWGEVLTWDEQTLVARLIDGAAHTTEWRKGAQVEVAEDQIEGLAIARDGRTLDEDEMMALLDAERPM